MENALAIARHETCRLGLFHAVPCHVPGGFKAPLRTASVWSMKDLARLPGVAADACQKRRVPRRSMTPNDVGEHEPRVGCVSGSPMKSTGYGVSRSVQDASGEVPRGGEERAIRSDSAGVSRSSTSGGLRASWFINCDRLHSDEVALAAATPLAARIASLPGKCLEQHDWGRVTEPDLLAGATWLIQMPSSPSARAQVPARNSVLVDDVFSPGGPRRVGVPRTPSLTVATSPTVRRPIVDEPMAAAA